MTRKESAKEYFRLFLTFFKIGLFTIGGGYAMVPVIHRVVVKERKWLSEEEMIDCLALTQALPGAIAVSMATYVGDRQKGFFGSVLATIAVILPSFICIIAVILLLGSLGDNKHVNGVFIGIKAAVCGTMAVVAYNMGKQLLKGWFTWIIAVIVFTAVTIFEITAIWPVLFGAAAGIIYLSLKERKKLRGGEK